MGHYIKRVVPVQIVEVNAANISFLVNEQWVDGVGFDSLGAPDSISIVDRFGRSTEVPFGDYLGLDGMGNTFRISKLEFHLDYVKLDPKVHQIDCLGRAPIVTKGEKFTHTPSDKPVTVVEQLIGANGEWSDEILVSDGYCKFVAHLEELTEENQ